MDCTRIVYNTVIFACLKLLTNLLHALNYDKILSFAHAPDGLRFACWSGYDC